MALKTVKRFDRSRIRLDGKKPNGAGALVLGAQVARTGIQVYKDSEGNKIREYRSPDEVFSEDSLATLGSIPVTVGHPRGEVNPQNWKLLSVGHVSEGRADRVDASPVSWLDADLVISDSDVQDSIDRGDLVEISMGYTVLLDHTPGETPDGEKYDALQKSIAFNHAALLPEGSARAGSDARLRLDGNQQVDEDDKMTVKSETPVKTVIVDGSEPVEVGSEKHLALVVKPHQDKAEALQAKADDLQAKLDEAESQLADAAEKLEGVFQASARKLVGDDYSFEGKARSQVYQDGIKAARPKFDIEGRTDSYLEALFQICLDDSAETSSKEDSEDYSQTQTQPNSATGTPVLTADQDYFNQMNEAFGRNGAE